MLLSTLLLLSDGSKEFSLSKEILCLISGRFLALPRAALPSLCFTEVANLIWDVGELLSLIVVVVFCSSEEEYGIKDFLNFVFFDPLPIKAFLKLEIWSP
ncbi:hypothetical protein AWRI1631_151830 [Saccharomyces cerevisiae AWRI1631]|uniref:Uncharacterized protein n=1 Tax=Saccharomyces cerevisiae (strain AWRI1631) TaxID=545124 RepID=B5VRS3_YEAS6|nr:hypothetical protein AWRI1631_151830 [Saccharomyces cerevisiae AWRI1631]